MAITAPTPIMMPSIVKMERSLLRANVRIAIRRMALMSIIGSILQCREILEHVRGARAVQHAIVAADLAVPKLNRALREASNIWFVSHKYDRQALVVKFL